MLDLTLTQMLLLWHSSLLHTAFSQDFYSPTQNGSVLNPSIVAL